MKKTLSKIAAMVLLTVAVAAADSEPTATSTGYLAPTLTVTDGDKMVSLQALQGQTVVIDFWTASNATSRVKNRMHDREAQQGKYAHIGINMDRSRGVCDLTIASDGLDDATQVHVDEALARRLMSQWHVTGDNTTFTIDASGKVTAAS